jgi:hypothetical protein
MSGSHRVGNVVVFVSYRSTLGLADPASSKAALALFVMSSFQMNVAGQAPGKSIRTNVAGRKQARTTHCCRLEGRTGI